MSLPPVLSSTTFLEESQSFFSSLYEKVVLGEDEEVCLCPSLRFLVGEESLSTHLFIMRHYCSKLKEVLVSSVKKEKGGVGVANYVTCIPEELGVTPLAFKMFRRAIYMKEFDPPTFDILVQVRRLAEKFGCSMVLEKCDGLQISMENCHVVFDKWPEGSEVQTKALDFVKGNLKTLVETERTVDWSQVLWQTVLSLNDLLTPVPSEDELFQAALNWQHKHRTAVDRGTFRLLFRDLFRYPLMTEYFLLSTVRDSGILDPSEVLETWDEKEGRRSTDFNKTPRTAIGLPFASCQAASDLPTPTTSTSFSTTPVQRAEASGALSNSHMETDQANGANNTNASKKQNQRTVVFASHAQVKKLSQRSLVIKKSQKPSTSLPQRIVVSKNKGAKIEGENGNTGSKRKRCNSPELTHNRKSRQTQVPNPTKTNPPVTNVISLPPKKRVTSAVKSVASTFEELQEILQNATVGEQIELTAGTFNGHIRLDGLPEGVRIFGAGKGQTILKAARNQAQLYNIKAGKGCTFQDLTFKRDPNWENGGFCITGDGVKIHNVDFDGCYLGLLGCVEADVRDVRVENSPFGIWLDSETKNSLVKNVTLNQVTTGIDVSGSWNTISGVECNDVDCGVFFCGTPQDTSVGNSLTDLTYTFSKELVTDNLDSEQNGVRINYSKSNVVENVKCIGYDDVKYGTKRLRRHVGACAIWIRHTGRAGLSTPNKLKGISGGPIWVGGEGNVIEDVTDCPFLQARGSQHQFINCIVGQADTKEAKKSVYTDCNFDATSCEKASWVTKGVSMD